MTRHGGSGSILDALNLSYSGNRLSVVSHPGGTWSYGHEGSGRMTSDGRLGGIAVQYGETGLPRRTMGPPGSGITTTEYSYLADETRLGVAQNRGSGPKDAQRKVNKGQGPKDIKRIDAPNISENSQWHAHGKNGSAINIDGTVHDKHRGNPPFARRTLNWLQEHGWDIDNYIQNQK